MIMLGGDQLPDDFRLFVDFLPKQGFHRVIGPFANIGMSFRAEAEGEGEESAIY